MLELLQTRILLIYGLLALVACAILMLRILKRRRMRVVSPSKPDSACCKPGLSLLKSAFSTIYPMPISVAGVDAAAPALSPSPPIPRC